jgi:hypothetical protein
MSHNLRSSCCLEVINYLLKSTKPQGIPNRIETTNETNNGFHSVRITRGRTALAPATAAAMVLLLLVVPMATTVTATMATRVQST